MTTEEERLSRLEGVYEHLASKADVAEVKTEIAEVKAEVRTDIAAMEARLVKWFAALLIGTALDAVTATAALTKLLG